MPTTTKYRVLTLFTITVFIALASIDNAVLEMASGIYWAIIDALDSTEFGVGLANSILVWITSVTSMIWAYAGDKDLIKGGRKRLLLYGTIIWSASLAFTPTITSIEGWILLQCIAGTGLGSIFLGRVFCINRLGFSQAQGHRFFFLGDQPDAWLGGGEIIFCLGCHERVTLARTVLPHGIGRILAGVSLFFHSQSYTRFPRRRFQGPPIRTRD